MRQITRRRGRRAVTAMAVSWERLSWWTISRRRARARKSLRRVWARAGILGEGGGDY